MTVFAAGDSFNDLAMLSEADSGCLFRAPESIRKDYAIPCVDTYDELLAEIDRFLHP
jgi:phosphoserine/homoserine phosphotransferase